jgi:hypothetical protein
VTQSAREYQASRNLVCCDTAARKQRIDIKVFALLIGAHDWLAVFKDPIVMKVTPAVPSSNRPVRRLAVMPLSLQMHLERLASSHPSKFVRVAAGTMALGGILDLRCTELQRCRLLNEVTSTDADPNVPLSIRCDAGKGQTRATMFPFEMTMFPEGYGGDARGWLTELCSLSYGQAAILPDFVSKGRPGSILDATEWQLGTPLLASKWPKVCADLFSLPPLCLTAKQLKAIGWNVHAPHSLGAEIVRVFLDEFSAAEFHEISRWSKDDNSTAPLPEDDFAELRAAAMPLQYTDGTGAARELNLRRRVTGKARDFVEGHDWQQVVPFQTDGVISFDSSGLRLCHYFPVPPTSHRGHLLHRLQHRRARDGPVEQTAR